LPSIEIPLMHEVRERDQDCAERCDARDETAVCCEKAAEAGVISVIELKLPNLLAQFGLFELIPGG
jgi:hypothetical protein